MCLGVDTRCVGCVGCVVRGCTVHVCGWVHVEMGGDGYAWGWGVIAGGCEMCHNYPGAINEKLGLAAGLLFPLPSLAC